FSSRRRHTRFSRDWSSDVCSSDLLDVCKGVFEDDIARGLQKRLFPIEFPFGAALGQRKDTEIHRTHVERAHLGLGGERRRQPLIDRKSACRERVQIAEVGGSREKK